jgi:hypothetical protein
VIGAARLALAAGLLAVDSGARAGPFVLSEPEDPVRCSIDLDELRQCRQTELRSVDIRARRADPSCLHCGKSWVDCSLTDLDVELIARLIAKRDGRPIMSISEHLSGDRTTYEVLTGVECGFTHGEGSLYTVRKKRRWVVIARKDWIARSEPGITRAATIACGDGAAPPGRGRGSGAAPRGRRADRRGAR